MDIDHLKTFLTVAQLESFSLAGEKLHLTQPAISKRISALEDRLDTKLLDRLSKRVELTPAGTELLPKAQAILSNFEDLLQTAASTAVEVKGELHIATSHHLGLHKLPEVLKRFVSEHPQVNLKIDFLDSEVVYQRIINGNCEVGLVTMAPEIPPTLLSETLWTEPLIFVSSIDSPMPSKLQLRDLSQYPALLPDQSTYTGKLIKRHFDSHGVPLLLNTETNYFETLKMLVGVGLGWSALPQPMMDQSLKSLEISNVSLNRELGVVYHKKRTLSRQAKVFLSLLRNRV